MHRVSDRTIDDLKVGVPLPQAFSDLVPCAYIENENGVLLAYFPLPRSIQKRISSLWMNISK